ncbi:DUF4943 family protein [Bacteroides heparinolyticus]|uniref:DUF4943 domain-containing protein n=1 Tax=Prevotella heparinolytica TaxID=28113 RepID=A0A3P2ABN4_9BACE|nr:DUF4943 family protein [Bacteroides heparinolyticus]MCI6211824.1 DUF4943 domain-containing protein [Bacteroides heparinolyticus]RRD92255.1 DUF4943 domain-containing protein [Bacteroides heparinolyticus]TCO90666.1 uncharacterized protein DUF4943 [Bacteroides heparinolyticus]
MKTLYRKLHIHSQFVLFVFFTLSVFSLFSCSKETLDYNHPNVDLFVKQLKAGKYSTQSPDGLSSMPKFTSEDIEGLLKYVEDLTVIPSFPLAPVSYSAGGKLRLGECILWTVETIRLGHNASMGCKMVHTDAENYEGIYFLSDDEVLDAAARYRRWWETRKYPRTMWTVDPCYDEPLCGSGYMWW